MIFQRRDQEDWKGRLRVFLWPRRSWWRSSKYLMLRVVRLTASPNIIAMGVAAGVFASFTPFMGFHFVIAFALCFILGGSYIASATGTFFGNPITFPFIWAASYNLGQFVLGNATVGKGSTPALSFDMIWSSYDLAWGIIKPMAIGGCILGVVFYLGSFFIVRKIALIYKKSRIKTLADAGRRNLEKRLEESISNDSEEIESAQPRVQTIKKTVKPKTASLMAKNDPAT